MRALTLSAAVVALLAAGPALAGDPRSGGHHHRPPPGPCCGQGGGSHINAHAYDVGVVRGGYGGGTVYVSGGSYGGYSGGYGYGAPAWYDVDRRALACASAPFGYMVSGFGRDDRRPPSCGYVGQADHGYDRGGRYGYSERHGSSYEERTYESYESYGAYGAYEGGYDRRGDCDCREPAPYPPPYLPEPPRYEPPAPPARPHRPRRPRHDAPRQQYRQEIGERG